MERQSVALAVLNEGVGDTPEFSSPAGSKKQVVLGPDFQGADGVLAEVVIQFNASVVEVDFEAAPLVEGVGDGLAHAAFWQVQGADLAEILFDEFKPGRDVAGADGVAQGGSGFFVTKALFKLVGVGDELNDAGGAALSGVEGSGEAAPDVGHAAAELDVPGVVFLIAGIDAVAIALNDAGPVQDSFAEGLFEVFTAAAFLPTVADAASGTWVVEDPDVAGAGFSGAGSEFFDGSFVGLKVVFFQALPVDGFGDGLQEFEAAEGPVVQGVAGGVEAKALEDVLLAVEREVIGVFRDDEMGGEAEGGDAAAEWTGGCGGDEGRLGAVVLIAKFGPDGAALDDLGGDIVELFGNVLADEFELVLLVLVTFGEDGFFDDLKGVPAFEPAVVFSFGLFVCGLCFGGLLRCGCFFDGGVPGLSRRESFEEELELGGVDLFAFRAVEELDEKVDFSTQQFVLGGEPGDDLVFLVGRFNALFGSSFRAN